MILATNESQKHTQLADEISFGLYKCNIGEFKFPKNHSGFFFRKVSRNDDRIKPRKIWYRKKLVPKCSGTEKFVPKCGITEMFHTEM